MSKPTPRHGDHAWRGGHGPDYRPWLTVRTAPSRGLVSRIDGLKTHRVHHLLSDLELSCFLVLEWRDDVVDIREQFPLLPMNETKEIAADLGALHPQHHGRHVVMTTDFVVTCIGSFGTTERAFACKPSGSLNKRTAEKLEIERHYWMRRNTPWELLTPSKLPHALLRNIKWVRSCIRLDGFTISPSDVESVAALLEKRVGESNESLSWNCRQLDGELGLPVGTCLRVARHAIGTNRWPVDMTQVIEPDKPLSLRPDAVTGRALP